MRRFLKCCATPSVTAQPRESIWNDRTGFRMAKPLKDSGRFTNAKASLASSAARASGASRTAVDQLTGARNVSEDDYLAALPPDVRKVSDLPAGRIISLGLCPNNWAQPRSQLSHFSVGQSRHRTSGGKAAHSPVRHHSPYNEPMRIKVVENPRQHLNPAQALRSRYRPYKFPKIKSVIICRMCLTRTGSVTPWRDLG